MAMGKAELRGVRGTMFSAEIINPDSNPGLARHQIELNDMAKRVAELFSANAISPHLVTGLVRIGEFLLLTGISLIIFWTYVRISETSMVWYFGVSLLGSFLTVCFVQAIDGYQIGVLRSFLAQYSKAITGFSGALIALLILGFLTKTSAEFSRVWFATWGSFGVAALFSYRAAVSMYIKRELSRGRLERRAVVVGGGASAAELIRSLEALDDGDIRICGIFDDRDEERSPAIVAGYPKLGTIPELVEFGRKARIDMLIVSLPISAESRVLQLLKRLWVLPVDIRLSTHTNKLRFRPRSYSYEGSVAFLDLFEKPIADWDAVMKRSFDLVFATLALAMLFPIMLAAAIAIRLDSKGPIIFRQKRFGFNNEVIEVLKFRSMYHEMADPSAKRSVTKDDPRVTRVGRFIRKTSIDELPQLFNVLSGRLSLVGPRPHAVNAHTQNRLWDEVVDGYFARHKVKPGVTGWAQVNGWRGEVDDMVKIAQRVDHDLYYIENWSLVFDLYILAITPFRLLNTENAY